MVGHPATDVVEGCRGAAERISGRSKTVYSNKKPGNWDTPPLNVSKALFQGTAIRCRLRLMVRLFTEFCDCGRFYAATRRRPVKHGRSKSKHGRSGYRRNVNKLAVLGA